MSALRWDVTYVEQSKCHVLAVICVESIPAIIMLQYFYELFEHDKTSTLRC